MEAEHAFAAVPLIDFDFSGCQDDVVALVVDGDVGDGTIRVKSDVGGGKIGFFREGVFLSCKA